MTLVLFFVPCLVCQVAYAHDWPTFLGPFSRAEIPEHLALSGNLVGSSLIVVERPMEPTKEQKFVAGVTGAALVSLKFVQTSGQEGVSVAYKPAMHVKRFIFVTPAFMAAHSQVCRHLVDIFNLATCKWKLLSRDELDSKINGDLKVNMNRQIIVLQAAGEEDGSSSDYSFQKQ